MEVLSLEEQLIKVEAELELKRNQSDIFCQGTLPCNLVRYPATVHPTLQPCMLPCKLAHTVYAILQLCSLLYNHGTISVDGGRAVSSASVPL